MPPVATVVVYAFNNPGLPGTGHSADGYGWRRTGEGLLHGAHGVAPSDAFTGLRHMHDIVRVSHLELSFRRQSTCSAAHQEVDRFAHSRGITVLHSPPEQRLDA